MGSYIGIRKIRKESERERELRSKRFSGVTSRARDEEETASFSFVISRAVEDSRLGGNRERHSRRKQASSISFSFMDEWN